MQTQDPAHRIRLIDFSAESPPDQLAYAERIVHDGITVARCRLNPNPGCMIGALQHTVIIHESEPFDLEWQLSPTETLERRQIIADDLHISAAERPVFLRWQDTPKALVIALQQSFVEQVANDVCDQDASALRTMVAIRDPVIEAMAVAWRQELANRGSSGRLYAEHLGLALAIHLLRTYGDGSIPPHVATGGLTSRRLRQITIASFCAHHPPEDRPDKTVVRKIFETLIAQHLLQITKPSRGRQGAIYGSPHPPVQIRAQEILTIIRHMEKSGKIITIQTIRQTFDNTNRPVPATIRKFLNELIKQNLVQIAAPGSGRQGAVYSSVVPSQSDPSRPAEKAARSKGPNGSKP